jgi:glycosyltransferase involved in cell wall biosynthesis
MHIFYLARINTAIEDASTRHVFEFCSQFARLGHQVTLFVPDLGSVRNLEGVRLVYVPSILKKSYATYFLFYLTLFFLLPFYFVKYRPKVIYTRFQHMEWMATSWKWIFSFVYVIEVNGLAPVELKINSAPGWWIKMVEGIEWISFRMPDLLVTSAPQLRDILCDKYGLKSQKFLVVSNGANPEAFKVKDSIGCRKKLNLALDERYLIFIGSFRKWHGLGQIILAMVPLVSKFHDLKLLLVGDGEELDNVKKLIAENNLQDKALLFGEKPYHEIPDYINAADICLGTFTDKPGISPLKIFEYMACGKPIISNAVGGMDVLFGDHHIGKLVQSHNPEDWAACIEEMLDHPEKMAEYGENGLEAVKNIFNWGAICKKVEADLERLVSLK